MSWSYSCAGKGKDGIVCHTYSRTFLALFVVCLVILKKFLKGSFALLWMKLQVSLNDLQKK